MQSVIRNTAEYLLISIFKGQSYSLTEHNGLRRTITLHNEDAQNFKNEYEAMCKEHPERDADTILTDMFNAYNYGV